MFVSIVNLSGIRIEAILLEFNTHFKVPLCGALEKLLKIQIRGQKSQECRIGMSGLFEEHSNLLCKEQWITIVEAGIKTIRQNFDNGPIAGVYDAELDILQSLYENNTDGFAR
jgi:hypothetical protein